MPKARNLAVKVMRESRGLRQNELMAKAGLSKTAMTRLESGRLEVTPRTLARIGRDLGYGPESVEWLVFALSVFTGEPELPPGASGLSREAQGEILTEGARRLRDAFGAILERLIEEAQGQRHGEERKTAAAHYRSLDALHPLRQEALLDERPELQTWAMVERYCEESEKAASDDSKRALLLANLALRCAQAPGIPALSRARLEAYAWAFIGNARRVDSDLPAAEEAFQLAWAAWRRGKRASALVPLGAWRLYDLEASLRREQMRLRASLSILTRALRVAPPSAIAKLLLKKATTYIVMGRPEKAILALEDAEARVCVKEDPQLYFALRFNLGVIMEQADRIEESWALLPELRDLATDLRSEVRLARVSWLQARLQARLGEEPEAAAGLEGVLRDFSRWQLAHDAAQAALELAILLLKEGNFERVRTLAQETLWVFKAQRLEPRILAALKIFCDAAAGETMSLAIAVEALREVHEARLLRP